MVLMQFSEMGELGLLQSSPSRRSREDGDADAAVQPPETPPHQRRGGMMAGGKLCVAKGPRGAPHETAPVQRQTRDVGCR